MALDNTNGTYDGRIYVSWTDFTGGTTRIKFSYSTDGGSNFSQEITLGSASGDPGSNAYLRPVDTTPGTPTADFVQGSMPAVGPDGELYVVWMEVNLSGNSYFKIRKSTNGGSSFASAVAADTFAWNRSGWGRIDHLNLPTLAVDQDNSYVYLAYKEDSPPRVKFKRSTDGGSGWGEAPKVIANLGEKGEVFPWLAVDSDGKVAVTLMHRRDNNEVDCYVAESYDRGATFRSPIKVTDQSSNPSNATWTHHYMGMVLDDEGNNYVVWTDYRNGNADAFFAKLNTPPEAPQNLVPSVVGENENPRIDWDANLETDLDGYEVWKKEDDGTWYLLATTKNNYYVDILENNVTLGDCQGCTPIYYKLKAVDLANNKSGFSSTVTFNQRGGTEKISAGPSDPAIVPGEYTLLQNYPNPFNPVTTIQFGLKEDGPVEVAVYSLTGQKLVILVNEFMEAGTYQVQWNGKDQQGSPVSAGMYLYQLKAGNQRLVKKMMLIK